MRCEDIKELLAAYLDEEVTPEERRQIDTHLAACEKCREELRLLASAREDLRQAMVAKAAGVEPSPQAWDRVRQRIGSKRLFWQQLGDALNRPVWRAAIPIVLVLVVIGALWGTGVLPGLQSGKPPVPAPSPTVAAPTVIPRPTTVPTTVPAPVITIPPAPAPALPPGVTPPPRPTGPPFNVGVDFVPSKTTFVPGETIEVVLKLKNNSPEPVAVTLPPKVSLVVPGPEPDSGTVVHTFPAGTQEQRLAVGETVTYKLTWDQKDEKGNPASPGWYFVDYMLPIRKESPPVMDWGQGGRSRLFLIQYPQGAMQKTIELNQSQTITGVPLNVGSINMPVNLVMTLKRVELTEKGASFFVLASSSNNPVSGYNNSEWAGHWATAQYVVDGIVKDARVSNTIFSDSGIELRWGYNESYLDPVPADAKELTFRITRLGDWQGPWEFKVQLK